MKKPVFTILISVLLMQLLTSQSDPRALSVLDKFSAAATSAPSVEMKFLMITNDQAENSTDTTTGTVLLSRDSYRLDLPDNIVWFNGEISWSYLPAEEEVTITKPDKKDNSFQSKPSAIFTMYRKGYKCRLIDDKADTWVIDLYPEDLKSDMVRVRLTIAKPSLSLRTLEYKRKDGVVVFIVVKDYNLTKIPQPGAFVFPAGKYSNAEVNDMR